MKRDNITWCLKQKKGIRLVTPNDNLCKQFLNKARSSLNMLDAAVERNENEWIITTAYYARYFSLYALLQKCGIKSEIHDCSIEAFKLFIDIGAMNKNLLSDISSSKDLRIGTQYYVSGTIERTKLEENVKSAREFVLVLEEFIEKISKEQIDIIRRRIKTHRRAI